MVHWIASGILQCDTRRVERAGGLSNNISKINTWPRRLREHTHARIHCRHNTYTNGYRVYGRGRQRERPLRSRRCTAPALLPLLFLAQSDAKTRAHDPPPSSSSSTHQPSLSSIVVVVVVVTPHRRSTERRAAESTSLETKRKQKTNVGVNSFNILSYAAERMVKKQKVERAVRRWGVVRVRHTWPLNGHTSRGTGQITT